MKAIWRDQVLAESTETVVVEGNHYFPPQAVNRTFLRDSAAHTHCPWKGEASYYDVIVGDDVNSEAAWFYPEPTEAAIAIANHIAFWHGVEVVDS